MEKKNKRAPRDDGGAAHVHGAHENGRGSSASGTAGRSSGGAGKSASSGASAGSGSAGAEAAGGNTRSAPGGVLHSILEALSSFVPRGRYRKGGQGAEPGREEVRRGNIRLGFDLSALLVGFLFGGCHLLFGAYPLGLSFVAALPYSVWFALVGVIVGSLTLGRAGIIYALITLLVVFLRVVISGGESRSGNRGGVFRENVLLRSASGIIGGFVAGVYELLLGGFNLSTVLFLLAMTLFPVLLVPLISGLFVTGFSPESLLLGGSRIFDSETRSQRENLDLVFFRISALSFAFLIALSLRRFAIFGVDISLIFAVAVTLFAAKRFGALYGMAVGFASSVGVSALFSPAFALFGLTAGWLFPFGAFYAPFLGVVALSAYGAYAGGVSGLLSVLPEGLIGSLLMYPAFKHLESERKPKTADAITKQAVDMVGTMALAYRASLRSPTESLEEALTALSHALNEFLPREAEGFSPPLPLVSELVYSARSAAGKCGEIDEEMTSSLEAAFSDAGFHDGVIRAFGDRKKYIVAAALDKDGLRITSPQLKRALEAASGCALMSGRFFRRGDMVLMETEPRPMYRLECATASRGGDGAEVSGDSIHTFSSERHMDYAVISDGMGSGETADKTARFATGYFDMMKECECEIAPLVYMLNDIIRARGEECALALDLFRLDMYAGSSGGAVAGFFKAGAAPSYIKRGGSLFRIKSESMPIGVMKRVSAELIKADVKENDIVIMMSDGIPGADDEAPWLIEYLKREVTDMSLFARGLVELASHHNSPCDDMSVVVARVIKN